MFFRMLKNDLRSKRGLNIILFLFITIASALVFVGAAQVYSSLTGNSYTQKVCRTADVAYFTRIPEGKLDEMTGTINKMLDENDKVKDHWTHELVRLKSEGVDFPHYEEKDSDVFLGRSHLLSAQFTDCDLVFDENDKPFYVKNGQVALSVGLKELTGVQAGDKIRFTTDLGNVYELEVSTFFKSRQKARYIVSDADFARIAQDFPLRYMQFSVNMASDDRQDLEAVAVDIYNQTMTGCSINQQNNVGSDDEIIANIVSVFVVLISLFMILLILMTIRFTMIAALKEEEKEIGMMRAIGVDSLKFRWLFAAKYIAFAVVGGMIGAAIGLPVSRKVVLMFGSGRISPSAEIMTALGIAAVAGIVLVMILFSVFVMRRMKRISVIDAIHGENRGERFGRHTALHLSKRRKMPVPLYLAVSDIMTRFKRYIFLILAYTLGASIILLTASLRHSVIHPSFMRYYMVTSQDFIIDFNDTLMQEYYDREAYDGIPFFEQINAELKDAGIPAHVDLYNGELATWKINGQPLMNVFFCYDLPDTELLTYREGGRAPKLANEAAMSWFSAKQMGISIGDTVDISFSGIDEDSGQLVQKEYDHQFVITGFLDYAEQDEAYVIAGTEYQHDNSDGHRYNWLGFVIDSEDKDAVFQQICDKYGRENIKTAMEYTEESLEDYDNVLTLLMRVMTGTVLFVNVLITVLYLNIFLAEDTPEIALLKSLGFTNRSVRCWQLLRMILLTLLSVIVAIILYYTGISALAGILFEAFIGLTGFEFLPFRLFVYVMMPALMLGAVLLPTLLRMQSIRHIDIRQMNEE